MSKTGGTVPVSITFYSKWGQFSLEFSVVGRSETLPYLGYPDDSLIDGWIDVFHKSGIGIVVCHTIPSQHKGPGFTGWLRPFCMDFLQVLQQSCIWYAIVIPNWMVVCPSPTLEWWPDHSVACLCKDGPTSSDPELHKGKNKGTLMLQGNICFTFVLKSWNIKAKIPQPVCSLRCIELTLPVNCPQLYLFKVCL